MGDDQQWADPALDDANWEPIRVDQPWGQQSHPSYTGFAWYRLRIAIGDANSDGSQESCLLIPPVQDAYEIYWNGQKLGTYGSLPPHAKLVDIWPSGPSILYREQAESLALRVWKAPLSSVDAAESGGSSGVPPLGDSSVLAARAQSVAYPPGDPASVTQQALIVAVTLVIGMLSFLLYLRDRKQGFIPLAGRLPGCLRIDREIRGIVGLSVRNELPEAIS